MSEEHRNTNKHSTGTVPKAKYRNNTSTTTSTTSYVKDRQERPPQNITTNNLVTEWLPAPITPWKRRFLRDCCNMDPSAAFRDNHNEQNGLSNYQNANGVSSSHSSSRRNSGPSLKCDNVVKCPDKKQIEDKLSQIRKYLSITNSMAANLMNSEELGDQAEQLSLQKMIDDLKDSESKLVKILDEIDGAAAAAAEVNNHNIIENNHFENNNNSIHDENDNENQIHEIGLFNDEDKASRQFQELAVYDNDMNSLPNRKDKIYTEHDFDAAIKQLEDRAKRLKEPRSSKNLQDKITLEVEALHSQLVGLQSETENRNQLIEALDNRHSELRSQREELKMKLAELQQRKNQVDQLATQLQVMDEEEEEESDEIGSQVRKIVTMKDHLKKLKDMLEIVKNSERVMENSNAAPEERAAAWEACVAAENILHKEKPPAAGFATENNVVLRYDNNSIQDNNRNKQVNKNTREQCEAAAYRERTALQAELVAKKKELEELMGKHKAATSNLNHDVVGFDNKSDFAFTPNSNSSRGAYWRQIPQPNTSDHYSSDEEDDDGYSPLDNKKPLLLPNSSSSFAANQIRPPASNQASCSDYYTPVETLSMSRTPERNVRAGSIAASTYSQSINTKPETNQVQKQLHLIKSVCESMLEQQQQQQCNQQLIQSNVQQLRNNLSPSPLYSEPRRYSVNSPNGNAVENWNNSNIQNSGSNNGNLPAEMNYQNWLATNTLQTQSFMLNTLNQCCQMLWMQQREMAALRSTVSMLQERLDMSNNAAVYDSTPLLPNSAPAPDRPSPLPNQFQRPANHLKVNQVSAACSMPNLNHYNTLPPHSNVEMTYNNSSNNRLLDPHHSHHPHQCLNNVNLAGAGVASASNAPNVNLAPPIAGDHVIANNAVLHGVNANLNHNLMANQMAWNGQALNNQVAPGIRANNYWDNFRSYSRQNLLSTKNNEAGFQTGSDHRTNPFTASAAIPLSKSNSEQESQASSSHENTPQRRPKMRMRHVDNNTATAPSSAFSSVMSTSAAPTIPPDVLNVNHAASKTSDVVQQGLNADNLGFEIFLNTYENSSTHSNISEEVLFKECIPEQCRMRNEWHNDAAAAQEEPTVKTKLSDELRENVYKEVASLISANEARPHFLIQLFRDLQLIGSDSLRLKTLQSVQTVITHSLLVAQHSNRDALEMHPHHNEIEGAAAVPNEGFSMQSTVWSKQLKSNRNINLDQEELQNPLREIIPFLNDHESEIVQPFIISNLKQILLQSDSFKELVKDSVFQKHFSNILEEVLEQYYGKKLLDVKMHMIQTLNDLFRGEISFIQLLQETTPENCNSSNNDSFDSNYEQAMHKSTGGGQVESMQNGDLAEADQSRGDEEVELEEEEGAVGGFLEVIQVETHPDQMINQEDVVDLAAPSIDFPPNAEGLDQVPTRLPTKSKSRSTTPNTGQ